MKLFIHDVGQSMYRMRLLIAGDNDALSTVFHQIFGDRIQPLVVPPGITSIHRDAQLASQRSGE